MPAPTSATFSLSALAAANTAFRDLVDSGSGPGVMRVRNASDVLLAEIPLTDPCGTVNGATGRLTITASGPDVSADANGSASYVEICNSAGVVHLALPAQSGTSPVAGYAVLNTLTIVAGSPVDMISATIG